MNDNSLITPVIPQLKYFARLQVEVGQPTSISTDKNGERKLIPIVGGEISGELQGKILSGGSDAIVIRPDGCAVLNARYCVTLSNGNHIYIEDRGFRHGPEFVMARLAQGQPVNPAQYYFRTSMTMETNDKDLAWLNKTLFIGSGCRQQKQVIIDLFQVQ